MHVKGLNEVVQTLKKYLREYIEDRLPGVANQSLFNCIYPDHQDSTPSCHIFGEGENLRGYCHGCLRSFDTVDACCILEGKPSKGKAWITETLSYLCNKFDVPFDIGELTDDELYEIDTYRAYKVASDLIVTKLVDNEVCQPALEETNRRGWTQDTLNTYRIGTIPSYDIFVKQLEKAGFKQTFLKEIDLANKSIFSPQNLIFPWFDEHGRAVGFIGRNLSYIKGGESSSKYHNTKTTGCKCNIFRKDSRLYGIDTAIKTSPPLWIFEGQPDCVSCKQGGLLNCASLSTGILSSRQIDYIKSLGIYSIILCLDGDQAGQNNLIKIIDERLPEHRDLDVKVVILPQGEDPDSFVRTYGIDALLALPRKTVFEWKLDGFDPQEDSTDICKEIIPYIAMEPSPVRREIFVGLLSSKTDVSKKSIEEELQQILDAKAYQVSRERDSLIDKVIHELRINPTSAEEILKSGHTDLLDINIKRNTSIFSLDLTIQRIEDTKEKEEAKGGKFEGFLIGNDLSSLQERLQGNWLRDVLLFCASKPNCGKTSLVSKLAWSISSNPLNENTVVIVHSIDDTLAKVLPRLVCIADGSFSLAQFHVSNPNFWTQQNHVNAYKIRDSREAAYSKVLEQIRKGRLVIKDATDGQSFSFIESMFAHYTKDPSTKVVYFLDNFHKLPWFSDQKDERTRWRKASCEMKRLVEKYHITAIETVEYHKVPPGTKPGNYSLAETQQIEYDADFIMHLYNELADIPAKCKIYHVAKNWKGEQETFPRIEVTVGKNKISDNKSPFFLDFFPYCSDFKYVDTATVLLQAAQSTEADVFYPRGL